MSIYLSSKSSFNGPDGETSGKHCEKGKSASSKHFHLQTQLFDLLEKQIISLNLSSVETEFLSSPRNDFPRCILDLHVPRPNCSVCNVQDYRTEGGRFDPVFAGTGGPSWDCR